MFKKDDRCFSGGGLEYEYVCPTTDGKHIVRPVLESDEGTEVFGDLKQVDTVFTSDECDELAYAKRDTLRSEIEELERKRSALRLTQTQEEALAQHETLANLADWLAGEVMYFVTCADRDVEVRSTSETGGQLSIRRTRGVATCEWRIDGSKATFRGMFATKEQAEEVARSWADSPTGNCASGRSEPMQRSILFGKRGQPEERRRGKRAAQRTAGGSAWHRGEGHAHRHVRCHDVSASRRDLRADAPTNRSRRALGQPGNLATERAPTARKWVRCWRQESVSPGRRG